MLVRLLFTFLYVHFLYICNAQVDLKIMEPKKMKSDLDNLLKYIDAHPDPYYKTSEEDFKELVQTVEKNITSEMDLIDFYKNLSSLTAAIKDGHSSLYMPEDWLKDKRKDYGAFPYEVYLTDDNKLYVIDSYSDENTIAKGAEIIAINGMPVEEFIESIDPYISYELISFRNNLISEKFELYLYLAFKDIRDLEITHKVIKEETTKVKSMPFGDWKKFKKDNREERETKIKRGHPYDFEIIQEGVGKLDIYSFSMFDLSDYTLFLSNTFKKIKNKNVHSLIIDVRGNYGGWPKVASELFHYLTETHFKTMARSSMKISHPYRRYFTDANPNLRSAHVIGKSRHILDLKSILKGEIGTYSNEDLFYNEEPKKMKYEFDGDSYLLTDRQSYSASSSFASTFQCYGMGYVIGEPTGGTKIFHANAFRKKLRKSNFGLLMASTKFYTACYTDLDQPVVPHIPVEPTLIDRVNDNDSVLRTALMVIRKVQAQKANQN